MKFVVSTLKLHAFAFLLTLLIAATAAASSLPLSDIYQFSGPDGAFPNKVIADKSGNLYSSTLGGGVYNLGAIIQLFPPAQSGGLWTVSVLYSFTGGADGSYPGSLAVDAQGNLYGGTQAGGTGFGVIFELIHSSDGTWNEQTLHTFTGGRDGSIPQGAPVLDSFGNLYGLTFFGGAPPCKCGAIFQLSPSTTGWNERVLYSFQSNHPANPTKGLLLLGSNLYGSVLGTNTNGPSVFQLSSTGQFTWIYTLQSADGSSINATLTSDQSGNLYGVTDGGALFDGEVFQLSPPSSDTNSWTKTILYSFQGSTDGSGPDSLIFANGTLFGTTVAGGAGCSCGTLFALSNNAGTWTKKSYAIAGQGYAPGDISLIAGRGLFGSIEVKTGAKEGAIFNFSY